jgi:hypothetical protein
LLFARLRHVVLKLFLIIVSWDFESDLLKA